MVKLESNATTYLILPISSYFLWTDQGIYFFVFQASTDQTNIDIFLPFFVGLTVAMYITLLGIIFITCQVAWPTIIPIIPLAWLNFWYRVWKLSLLCVIIILFATATSQFYKVLCAFYNCQLHLLQILETNLLFDMA